MALPSKETPEPGFEADSMAVRDGAVQATLVFNKEVLSEGDQVASSNVAGAVQAEGQEEDKAQQDSYQREGGKETIDKTPSDNAPNPPFTKILKLARPEAHVIFSAFVLHVMSEVLGLLIPLVLARAYDDIVENYNSFDDKEVADSTKKDVAQTMINVLVLHSIGIALSSVSSVLMGVSGERVVARLRLRLYSHLLDLDMGFFDGQKSGELVSRLGNDTELVQSGVTQSLSEVSMGIIKVVVCVALMCAIAWKLTLIVCGVGATILVIWIPFASWISTITAKFQDALGEASNCSSEVLGSMRTVRSFGTEPKERKRYQAHIGDPSTGWWPAPGNTTLRWGVIHEVCSSGLAFVVSFIAVGALYACLWFGFTLLIDGEVSIGGLTAFQAYISQVQSGLMQIGKSVSALFQASGGGKRIFHLLERDSEVETVETNERGIQPEQLKGEIRYEGVEFAYPSRPEKSVLSNFTLDVPAKTTTALVGSSGSGKTTALQLLLMFYLPENGRIMIDGQNLRGLPTSWLRRQVALVQQEPVLFCLTIRENVRYGCTGTVTQEMIEDACKQANAHQFVNEFPEGYDTVVGERGVKLSGGQKQRIAIARALILSPKILLLDEATSALDAESERQVQEAIDRLMEERTTILVAHRLSTVKNAHQIAVTEGGSIVDVGKHQELMGRCEVYENLVKRQTV